MANIDDELVFLRDAGESSGPLSREAIANALIFINNDRAYPPNVLNVSENGIYDTDENHPYTKVNINVGEYGVFVDGIANVFTINKNGVYYAYDLFGKHMLITEFIVDVPEYTDLEELTVLNVTANGEYDTVDNQKYGKVVVDVPNVPEPGEHVTAAFYFLDPLNPNVESMTFLYKDEHVILGGEASDFLQRFPKLKTIKNNAESYFVHYNWNPDPSHMNTNQLYIPTWLEHYTKPVENIKPVDLDVFLYIVQNKLIDYFYDIDDEAGITLNDPTTHESLCMLYYYGEGITDADGTETNSCFAVDTGKIIDSNIYHPRFCDDTDISDINTRNPVDGDKYYWWGCSLIRAFAKHDRSILRRLDDLDKYDEYEAVGYTIESLLPSDILDAIIPISHYVTHPERVSTDYKYYSKNVPRDNLSYTVVHDTYYKVNNADIPVDPGTGQQSPRYAGLYIAQYNSQGKFLRMQLTTDATIVSGRQYFGTRDGYDISVDSPYISDIFPERTGIDRFNWQYQSAGWSVEDKNFKHSGVLFVNRYGLNDYKAYKFVNGSLVEYTGQNHFDYIYLHQYGYDLEVDAYRATEMTALCDAIQTQEGLSQYPDIDMENVFTIREGDNVFHYYFYRKTSPMVIYSFNPGTTNIGRFCEDDTNPQVFNDVYQHYIQNDIYKTIMSNTEHDEHEYLPTGDILSTEKHVRYAEGNFIEHTYAGDRLYWFYEVNGFINDIPKFIFYNYSEINNDMDTPPIPYHFERYFDSVKQKYDYKIVKGDPTDDDGYNTASVTLQVRNTSEKVTDKFLVKNSCEIHPINIDNPFNNLNMPLITNIENVDALMHGDKVVTTDFRIRGSRSWDSSRIVADGLDTDRNINRYIYADKKTIEYFQEAVDRYNSSPDEYEMPTLADTQNIWQDFYDNFDTYAAERYEMDWPYELTTSYPPTKYPIIYEKLYFYL